MKSATAKPIVLSLAGHDPGGGAGIQADIEAIGAQGCHAATVITCLTVQDSRRVWSVHPVDAALLTRQAERIVDDYPVAALKIGLVPDEAIARSIAWLLRQMQPVPVVLDPVLHSGDGQALASVEYLQPLLALATVATPNREEARRLSRRQDTSECGPHLLETGCQAVLMTGADEAQQETVINTLYQPHQTRHWQWPRLNGSYHGSGCTLAASLAARLALGETLETAADHAQAYTWNSLKQGFQPGKGQFIPDRLDR